MLRMKENTNNQLKGILNSTLERDSHNNQTTDEYIKKMKERKRSQRKISSSIQHISSSRSTHQVRGSKYPSKPIPIGAQIRGLVSEGKSSNQIFLNVEKSALNEVTKPKTQGDAVQNMLSNCCNLMPNFSYSQSPTFVGLSSNQPIRSNQNKGNNVVNGMANKEKLDKEIEIHNLRYKRQRTNSLNRKRSQSKERNTTNHNDFQNTLCYSDPMKMQKKQNILLKSIKGVSQNFMSTFKKKTKEEQVSHENEHFKCDCNKDRRYRLFDWDSIFVCKLMINLISTKFNPKTAHEDLQHLFIKNFSKKEAPEKIREEIKKDVTRTFSDEEYLSNDKSRNDLQCLLECLAITFPEVGYVQGMNFIAAAAYYHSDLYFSYGFILVLFEYLELKDIFLPSILCII